ncbi:MAG: hypothetical protein M0R77_17680 [Gammaproteobacteria bacterium]|nr:hypothetical protein [Gammaproteobacteria bacterium]
MKNKKLSTVYLPKELDDCLKEMALMFSSSGETISVNQLIGAILCFQFGDLEAIDNDLLRTYYTLLS